MFTKVSEQRSAARRYALSKVAAGPTYNTGGWAPPAVARIPKTETPDYWPEQFSKLDGSPLDENASYATSYMDYKPIPLSEGLYAYAPVEIRAKADPRFGNWLSAHNDALRSLPINDKGANLTDLYKLPKTREALARAYHRKMYELTNGVPTRASAISTR